MEKYDIGLVVITTYNYGNSLTNYALFTILKNMGYRVLLIDVPWDRNLFIPNYCRIATDMFIENPYKNTDAAYWCDSRWSMDALNEYCTVFIVGSDQLWNNLYAKKSDYYTCLDWVESGKYKIAYATSLGNRKYDLNIEKLVYLLQRFQKISLREQQAVEWLNDEYGIKAKHVIDPVFLCDRKEYHLMVQRGMDRIKWKSYVGSYLLDVDEWKCKISKKIAIEKTDGEQKTITLPRRTKNKNFDIRSDFRVEEWMAFIHESKFYVTDSFHGLCLALIFHKDFIILFNKESKRGIERIESLLSLVGLNDRLILEDTENHVIDLVVQKPINYESIDNILNGVIKDSKNWLIENVQRGMKYEGEADIYDIFMYQHYNVSRIAEQKTIECQRIKNRLWMEQLKKDKGVDKMVAWGAGGCFFENIKSIKDIYNLEMVVDKDSEKWDEEFYPDIACVSPQKLWTMKNIVVLILTNYENVAKMIEEELLSHGISTYIFFTEWSKLILES